MDTIPVLTIYISDIIDNYKKLSEIAPSSIPAAVVKADAYGLGAAQISSALYDAGCRNFFVAHAIEGAEIRPFAPDANIYVLNGIVDANLSVFQEFKLTPVIFNFPALNFWNENKIPDIRPILMFNTGMNRFGFREDEIAKIQNINPENFSYLMSHLASGDELYSKQNSEQLARFNKICKMFPNMPATFSASDGIFLGAGYHFNMVRFGYALYGGKPIGDVDTKTVINLSAPVIQIFEVKRNETIGYNAAFTASRDMRIAAVSAGYADGLPWFIRISKRGRVFFDGKSAPIVGTVCMDMIMVDITDIPNVELGDMAEIIGLNFSIDDLGSISGTIGYELLCRIGNGKRIKKTYIK